MLPRATGNATAGHICPAGCYLPSPGIGENERHNSKRTQGYDTHEKIVQWTKNYVPMRRGKDSTAVKNGK